MRASSDQSSEIRDPRSDAEESNFLRSLLVVRKRFTQLLSINLYFVALSLRHAQKRMTPPSSEGGKDFYKLSGSDSPSDEGDAAISGRGREGNYAAQSVKVQAANHPASDLGFLTSELCIDLPADLL